MQIYDTATRELVELTSRVPGEVSIYNCGPTVYSDAHVGHARNELVFDVLRRYLTWRGWTVTYVRNFTDVEDKIIKRAEEEGTSATDIAERYIARYQEDMDRLGILRPDV